MTLSSFYRLARPALFAAIPPETAHRLTIETIRAGLLPRAPRPPKTLKTQVLGLDFSSPVGLAAGFDKDAETMAGLKRLGFGFAEVGSITPKPQPGNPAPRVFRLPEDKAVINRLGFNNGGHAEAKKRLEKYRARRPDGLVLGINVGANKTTKDKAADYVKGIKAFGGLADFFVVNISSPNTPGLRTLQDKAPLTDLVSRVMEARTDMTPVLLKIAPDLAEQDLDDIVEVALEQGLDGLVVSNTTVSREGLKNRSHADEAGGLSGAPLRTMSLSCLKHVRRTSEQRLTLVGVGGISSGADAYERIRAGASLVELYTGMIYEGPLIAAAINRELARLLRRDGFSHVGEAVGVDVD